MEGFKFISGMLDHIPSGGGINWVYEHVILERKQESGPGFP